MNTYTQQNHIQSSLARPNSFLGTIKSFVTAPFTWFAGSEDEFEEDAKGKRRRLPVISEDAYMHDESTPSKSKRQRLASPDRHNQPYLDPPGSAFTQPRRISNHSTGLDRDVPRSRKVLHLSSSSHQLPRSRRTVSPLPSGPHLKPLGMTRTMSLDPPSHSGFSSRIQPTPTILDLQSEDNHVGDSKSAGRDVSMSPRHLRVRSSLTPQPSGTGFGPVVPPRRERGLDEPPPLASLMSNPIFVKPPSGIPKQGIEPLQPLTLGTLLDSQHSTRALARQSSILFGTGSMTDVSARHLWPINKAEIALHELEVYKTPLLPTRLKGASAVPDMFVHKEKKHITLMTDDRPAKPRLGTKGKGKEKGKKRDRELINGTKPYAGEGGMKKWLARRKKEEEEAKERERAEAMEDERAEEEKKHKEMEAVKRKHEDELKIPSPPPAPVFEPRSSREGPLTSSLRVGRVRTGRNHIDRPVSHRPKFSAAFDEEDEEMEESRMVERKELEEAAKKAPAFELPAGFSFAKEATFTHDLTDAKEPPISSLPFSLTNSTPVAPTVEVAKAAPTLVPAVPKIALVPSTPDAVKSVPEPSSLTVTGAPVPSGIPNFFASSSVFAKPATVAPPPSLVVPAAEQAKPVEVPEPRTSKAGDAIPSLFGVPSRPISAFVAPPTTGDLPTAPKEVEKAPLAQSTLAPPFTFGAPAKLTDSLPTPASASKEPPAAEPVKPVVLSNGPFTFGATPLAPSQPSTTVSTTAASVTLAEAPKSVFTFGPTSTTTPTPAPVPMIAPHVADATKSVFGTPSPTTPFPFGQRPSTAPAEGKAASTSFSFGAPSTAEKKPTTGFTFDTSTSSTTTPASPAAFSFSAAPSEARAADISSKPFAFGPTPSARPATPPKAEQEVTMDESPARDMILNGEGKAPERPTLNFSFSTPSGSALFAQSPATTTAPFSFGGSSTSVNPFAKEGKKETKPVVTFGSFGQSSSTGFTFGPKPPESPVTAAPAPTPFQFTQPSPNIAPTSPFTFGAAATSAAPFGQTSAASTPSSPSTFNRSASFAFGAPPTTQPAASPFGFGTGSQPASPATGSTTLPAGATGSTPFTFGAAAAGTPAVGFGAPGAAASAGGSLFTMGSAPPPTEGAGGRRIKGLPRRGARR